MDSENRHNQFIGFSLNLTNKWTFDQCFLGDLYIFVDSDYNTSVLLLIP